MKKISILCLVLLIVALVGVQVVGNETSQIAEQKESESKLDQSSEVLAQKKNKTEKSEKKAQPKETPKKIDLVQIRMEDGYENSLSNLNHFKSDLKKEKVQVILTYNGEEFAKGYIGLNDQKSGLKLIYFTHTEHQEKPKYVQYFNRFREAIYNLKY